MYAAVLHLEVGNYAPEGVENRVEDESLQGSLGVSARGRNPLADGIQDFRNALSCFSRCKQHVFRLASQHLHHLIAYHVHHSGLHVDFVQNGNYLQIVFNGQIEVADGLGLNSLGCIHHQQGTLAGGDGS